MVGIKGAFFCFEVVRIDNFWTILGDKKRCVFPSFQKKKNAPDSSPKIQKGAFFWPFWKKSCSEKNIQYLSTCRVGQLFFQNR